MDKFFSQIQNQSKSQNDASPVTRKGPASADLDKDDSTPEQLPKGVVLGKDGKP